jgi:hypothetical protein
VAEAVFDRMLREIVERPLKIEQSPKKKGTNRPKANSTLVLSGIKPVLSKPVPHSSRRASQLKPLQNLSIAKQPSSKSNKAQTPKSNQKLPIKNTLKSAAAAAKVRNSLSSSKKAMDDIQELTENLGALIISQTVQSML